MLRKSMVFNAVIPENCKEDIPVVYLLHGLSDDHTMWCRRTSAERYADKYGIALIMPNADRSFYTDMKYGGKYYSYISEELVEYTRDLFRLSHKREKNFMCGLSMGGYGALKIAFRNPERYAAAVAFSGVADIVARIKSGQWPEDAINIWGENAAETVEGSDDDLFALAKKLDVADIKPRVRHFCGTEDFMYEDNLKFKAFMESSSFDYKYFEEVGGHSWDMWDKWLPSALEFFTESY
jgi:S-formylglutathione hydrolase FrmB